MTLVFDIVKSGRNAPKEHKFRFDTNGGIIGRSSESSWVLTDPQNYISGSHVRIEYKNETYFIVDESTNGTFLKFPYKKLPPGHPVPIKASDTFIIGDHEIQARFSNNDFGEDDIVVSHANDGFSVSELIPNDDFLFESSNSGFASLEPEQPQKTGDIMNLVGGNTAPQREIPDTYVGVHPRSNEPQNHSVPPMNTAPSLNQIIPDDAFDDDLDLSMDGTDKLSDPIHVPEFSQAENQQMPSSSTATNQQNYQKSSIDSIMPEMNEQSVTADDIIEPDEIEVSPSQAYNNAKSVVNGEIIDESLMILSKKLGIDLESLSSAERNKMMEEMGDAMVALFAGVHHTLTVTKKMQNDMDIAPAFSANTQSNPFGTNATPNRLLHTQNRKDMLGNSMSLVDAIKQSFDDINHHTISLHSATTRVFNSVGDKFSPRNLEYSMGTTKRFANKNSAMWEAYKEEFGMLDNNPQAGEKLFSKSFATEYETVAKSLNLTKKI